MFTLTGKYNKANVMIDHIDDTTTKQILSFLNDENFADTNIAIMPDCLTEDAEVLTKNGFKKICDLNSKDTIANYWPENKSVSFHKPLKIIKREKRNGEKIYSFTNKRTGLNMQLSENHRMAIYDNMGLKVKDVGNLYIKDVVLTASKITQNCNLCYTDNELKLIAWIVGDGNIKRDGDSYRIRFGIKKERKINKILEILDSLGVCYYIRETQKQTTISLNSTWSKKFIDVIGKNKHYPKELLLLNSQQARVLIAELIQVDGDFNSFINGGGYRLNSKRKEDIDFFSGLLAINGYFTSIKKRNNGMYYINAIKDEKLKYNRNGLHNSSLTRNEIKYEGNLVCLACDSSYFIARQNGCTFVTGNCHAGKGSVVGFTMNFEDKICPNIIGVDIGCGMISVNIGNKLEHDYDVIDKVIRLMIPMGFNVNRKGKKLYRISNYMDFEYRPFDDKLTALCKKLNTSDRRVKASIGSLGGGNHFIELGKDLNGDYWLTIHTGSRNLGKQVCDYWQNIAYETAKRNMNYVDVCNIPEKDRQRVIEEHKKNTTKINKDLCFLSEEDTQKYLEDMKIAQTYAQINRYNIMDKIVKSLEFECGEIIESVHNYIDFEDKIIRKGSIKSYKGQKMIIPFNMRDGILICEGKSNSDWNCSAPHGAGRVLSRTQAKKQLDLVEFKTQMKDIYSTSVNEDTLDEAPNSYKDSSIIEAAIEPTATIINRIKPVLNIKAC